MIYGYHIIDENKRYIIIYPQILISDNKQKYVIYKKSRNINANTYIGLVKEKNEVVPIEEVVIKYYS